MTRLYPPIHPRLRGVCVAYRFSPDENVVERDIGRKVIGVSVSLPVVFFVCVRYAEERVVIDR